VLLKIKRRDIREQGIVESERGNEIKGECGRGRGSTGRRIIISQGTEVIYHNSVPIKLVQGRRCQQIFIF
jgi:hypothetical protein